MRTRRPTLPDRAAIVAILHEDKTFNDDEIEVALELIDASLAGSSDYELIVGEDAEGVIRSYVCFGRTPMTQHTWDLYWIATHPAARGQGLASRLVRAMEQHITERRPAIVRIETSQLEAYGAARVFYERAGYAETGRIVDFYKPGDDLITFSKRLEARVRHETAPPAHDHVAQA